MGAGEGKRGAADSGVEATLPADEHTPMPSVLPRAATPAPAPTVVGDGRYELRGEVGRGGLGRVMRAHDRRLDRQIAVKELTHASAEATRRFLREARITAHLQHPSIVPIHDTGRLPDGTPFYSMKLVAGRSLADLVRTCTSLRERLALLPHIVAIAEAVAYAHSENIVHRDLKPQNVLIGQFGETTVIDWGLAKELGRADDDSLDRTPTPTPTPVPASSDDAQTMIGTVMGTPAFMPPEQARGDVVDKRADVYAIGAILYDLLTGSAPYAGHSADEILGRVQANAAPRVILVEPEVPRDLAAIVDRAMARERDERYPDAGALADDLKRFLTGQLVAAHGYSAMEIFRRWLGRHRALVSVTSVLLIALAVTGVVSFRRVVASREDARRQQHLAEGRRVEADAARVQAEARNNELMLMQARHTVDSDPTAALGWLAKVAASGGEIDMSELQVIAAEAVAGGVALLELRGHTVAVQRLRFVGDGDRLASLSDDGTVRVWDVRAGKQLLLIDGPRILDFDVSPDGRSLVVVDDSGAVRVRPADGGEEETVIGHHTGAATQVRYLPVSGLPCSAGADGAIHAWNPGGGAARSYQLDGAVAAFAVGDGDLIAAATEHGAVQLWRADGSPPIAIERDAGGARLLRIAPGGAWLAGVSDLELRVWRVDGKPRLETRVEASFTGARFSPGARWLAASGPARGTLIDLQQPRTPIDLASAESQVPEWSPDGQTLVLDARTSLVLRRIDDGGSRRIPLPATASSSAISPDGRLLVVGGSDGTIRVYDLAALPVGRSYALSGSGRAIALVPGGPLAAVGLDGALSFVDDAAGSSSAIHASEALLVTVAASSDGRHLATAGLDGTVRLWDLPARTPHELPLPKLDYYSAAAFSPGGELLAITGSDRAVRVWSLTAGKLVLTQALADEPLSVAWGPDGMLAVGTDPGVIVILDGRNGHVLHTLTGHTQQPTGLAFVDAHTLVSAGADKTVRRWDLATGTSVVLARHDGQIWGFAFDRDRQLIATSGSDRTIRITRLDGEGVTVLRGHRDDVSGVAFVGAGRLASTSLDKTLRVWSFDERAMVPRDLAAFRRWIARTTGTLHE